MPLRKLTREVGQESLNENGTSIPAKKIKLELEGSAMLRSGFGHSTALFPARPYISEETTQSTLEIAVVKEEVPKDNSQTENLMCESLHDSICSTSVLKVEDHNTVSDAFLSNQVHLPPVPAVLEQTVEPFRSELDNDSHPFQHWPDVQTNEKSISASERLGVLPSPSENVADQDVEVISEISERQYELVDLTDDVSPASTRSPSPVAENVALEAGPVTTQADPFPAPLLDFLDHNVIFNQELICQLKLRLENLRAAVAARKKKKEKKRNDDEDDDVIILDASPNNSESNVPQTDPKENMSSPNNESTLNSITASETDNSIIPTNISPEPVMNNKDPNANLFDMENLRSILNTAMANNSVTLPPVPEKLNLDCEKNHPNSDNIELRQNIISSQRTTNAKRPLPPQDEELSGGQAKKLNLQEYRLRDPRRRASSLTNTPSPPSSNQIAFPVIRTAPLPPRVNQHLSHEERTSQFYPEQSTFLPQTWNPRFTTFSSAQPDVLNSLQPLQHQNVQMPFIYQGQQYPVYGSVSRNVPVNLNILSQNPTADPRSSFLSGNCTVDTSQPPQIFHQTSSGNFHVGAGQIERAVFETPPSNGQNEASYLQNQTVQQVIVRPIVRVPLRQHPKPESTIPEVFKRKVGNSVIRSEHLHLVILDWDFMSMYFSFQNEELPNLANELNQVRNSYSDLIDYYNTYFPLMLVEYWCRLFRSYNPNGPEFFYRMTTVGSKKTNIDETTKIDTFLVNCDAIVWSKDVAINPKEKQLVLVTYLTTQFVAYVRTSVRRDFSTQHDSQHMTLTRNSVSKSDPSLKSKMKLVLEFACKPFPMEANDVFKVSKLTNFKRLLKQNDALLKLKKSPLLKVLLNPFTERWVEIIRLPVTSNPGEMTDAMDNLHLRVSSYDHHITLVTCCVPEKQSDFMPIIVSRLHRELQQRLLVCCKEENLVLFLDSLQMLGIEVMVLNRELRKNFEELKKRSVDKLAKNARLQDVLNSCEVLLAPTANCFYEDVRAVSFDTCIVFDADHFTEPDSVMCLSYDVRHLVLVGTPDKKCSTSKLTATWDYGKSLFQRAYDTS